MSVVGLIMYISNLFPGDADGAGKVTTPGELLSRPLSHGLGLSSDSFCVCASMWVLPQPIWLLLSGLLCPADAFSSFGFWADVTSQALLST